MDWKVVSAFAAGAVLASGMVYLAVRPQDALKPDPPKQVVAPPAPPLVTIPTPPQIAVTPSVPVARAPLAHVQTTLPLLRKPVCEKPSPMPPPVRRERPVTLARNVPPSLPSAGNVSLPAPVPAPTPLVEPRIPNVVRLATGMNLAVRIGETISSSRSQPGDTFLANLTQPLVIDGFVIAERGSRLEGRVLEAAPAERGRGLAHIVISVVRLSTSDGQNIRIRTDPYTKDGSSPAVINAAKVDVLLTRGTAAEIPIETRINFRVQDSVTITERLE
jgi:hypothetical protein